MAMMTISDVATRPFSDQKSGTAGLRKRVAVFQQPHYLQNYLQSIFDCVPALRGATLVIGGDGRFFNRPAIATGIRMAAANGVSKVVVGQGGLLSTPAASNLIRIHGAAGGLVFTASHNPAGADGDFGIKLNLAGGGQAPESLTEKIYERSKTLDRYRVAADAAVELDRVGAHRVGEMALEVVDPVDDYAALMQKLFDFDRMRDWLKRGHGLRFDALHAVTGPYGQRLFVQALGAPLASVQNGNPLEDFGGGHPDPNLIHARHLLDLALSPQAPDLIAASDGDGDRNMILGRGIFISPGDSLAMLAAHLHLFPGYPQGLAGVARSMPTSRAADRVAAELKVPCFETPTGWKFFASLLDAGKINLCGEESFGTSSSHVREKDGVWAVLAWLNLLAATGKSVKEVADAHWRRFGRHYFLRHDYEDLPADQAAAVMDGARASLPGLRGSRCGEWTVSEADDFAYTDPVDGSATSKQGLRIVFGEDARIVLRLSGTGTGGATLRLYLERYAPPSGALDLAPAQALKDLIAQTGPLLKIAALTGKTKPDVET